MREPFLLGRLLDALVNVKWWLIQRWVVKTKTGGRNVRASRGRIGYGIEVRSVRLIHNLALVGFMGTGKSSVGRCVAGSLGFRFVDTDHLVEQRIGMKVAEIFARDGEARFRELERAAINELENDRRLVIATGGGLVVQPGNLESLRRHSLIVCLWASPEAIWRRVRHQGHRPLLRTEDPMETIRLLLQQRQPYYRQADVLLNTERRSVRAVAQQVLHHFRLATGRYPVPARPRF